MKNFFTKYWRCVLAAVVGIGAIVFFWGNYTLLAIAAVIACLLVLNCRINKLEDKLNRAFPELFDYTEDEKQFFKK